MQRSSENEDVVIPDVARPIFPILLYDIRQFLLDNLLKWFSFIAISMPNSLLGIRLAILLHSLHINFFQANCSNVLFHCNLWNTMAYSNLVSDVKGNRDAFKKKRTRTRILVLIQEINTTSTSMLLKSIQLFQLNSFFVSNMTLCSG